MKRHMNGLCDTIACGLLASTVLGFFGKLHWSFDLFAHFRVQYMQIGLVLIAITLWKRLNKRAVALIALAVLNYAFVLPLYFGKPDPPTQKTIRAMLMNLNAANGNTDQVLQSIRTADPDLLLLEEVTPKWATELTVLDANYPHRLAKPRPDCFGIMLLSRHPLAHGQLLHLGDAGVPSILADVYLPQGAIAFIGTHPVPPMNAEYSKHRNQQLVELSHLTKRQTRPVLLVGDLNTTPFSRWFSKLLSESGLKNSMKGYGFQPSWPSNNRLLRIPLDHVLHSPKITIHHRAVLGDIGSDHFPVIVDFTVK